MLSDLQWDELPSGGVICPAESPSHRRPEGHCGPKDTWRAAVTSKLFKAF